MPTDADTFMADGEAFLRAFNPATASYAAPDEDAIDVVGLRGTIETVQSEGPNGGVELIDKLTFRVSSDDVAVPDQAATVTLSTIVYNIASITTDGSSFVLGLYRIRPQEVGLAQRGRG